MGNERRSLHRFIPPASGQPNSFYDIIEHTDVSVIEQRQKRGFRLEGGG